MSVLLRRSIAALMAVACVGLAVAGPLRAAEAGSGPSSSVAGRAADVVSRAVGAWQLKGTSVAAAGTASQDDPLLDTFDQTGAATVEPRGDISRVGAAYGADVLEVSVTVPGGVDPTTSPSFQEGFSGIGAAYDVNGDDRPDFASALVGDRQGGVLVATFTLPSGDGPFPVGSDFCLGTGRYDAASRTYVLEVPAICIGNAYEVRLGTLLIFDRMPGAEQPQLTIDLAPDVEPVPAVNRETTRDGAGYRFVAADGGIFSFGSATFRGSTGATPLNKPVRGMEVTPSGDGYWLVASDGGIFTFGDATFRGSTGGTRLNAPIVGMATTPTADGYWLVASDGGIFTFGDAGFFGSGAGTGLTRPVVGIVPTPLGRGYWLVTSDGEVRAFGDAVDLGSGAPFGRPTVDMAVTPSGAGYWLVAEDGTVTAFGDAPAAGDLSGTPLAKPIVGMAPTPTGRGYWLVGSDGGIFAFGDAGFFGSTGATKLNQPIVGITA